MAVGDGIGFGAETLRTAVLRADYTATLRSAVARLLSCIVFVVLMAVILPASAIVVVGLYLPWIVLRAVYLMATGRAKPRWFQTPEERARLARTETAPTGSLPF